MCLTFTLKKAVIVWKKNKFILPHSLNGIKNRNILKYSFYILLLRVSKIRIIKR